MAMNDQVYVEAQDSFDIKDRFDEIEEMLMSLEKKIDLMLEKISILEDARFL